MAKIRIIYKVMPSDVGDDIIGIILSKIREKSSELNYVVNDHRVEPVAFGLNALKILLTFDEESGRLDEFEKYMDAIPEVSSWEVVGMTRD